MKEIRNSGVLICPRYVLTSARVVPTTSDNFTLTGVRLGEWNTVTSVDCIGITCADPPQDIVVEKIVTHPDFNRNAFDHDIALLRLAIVAEYSAYVRPICLPSTEPLRTENDFDGTQFEVSGWKEASAKKQVVMIIGNNYESCSDTWNFEPATKNQICAGFENGDESKCVTKVSFCFFF